MKANHSISMSTIPGFINTREKLLKVNYYTYKLNLAKAKTSRNVMRFLGAFVCNITGKHTRFCCSGRSTICL